MSKLLSLRLVLPNENAIPWKVPSWTEAPPSALSGSPHECDGEGSAPPLLEDNKRDVWNVLTTARHVAGHDLNDLPQVS